MHVQVRMFGKPDTIVAVQSRLSKIEEFRKKIKEKFNVEPNLQRLFYGGKMLENGYTFHDYNIKINDVIQLMVMIPPKEITLRSSPKVEQNGSKEKHDSNKREEKSNPAKIDSDYEDAKSTFYELADVIDIRDTETGAWLEGKIVRIVHDPQENAIASNGDKSPVQIHNEGSDSNDTSSPEQIKKETKENLENLDILHENLLFKVQLDDEDADSFYCKFKDIRPRARVVVDIEDLKIGETVMINHNIDHPLEKGNWYDFKVEAKEKRRNQYNLVGTLYLGQSAIPQDDTTVRVHDKIFIIEKPQPLSKKTEELRLLMKSVPESRSKILNCLKCRDDEEMPCKECGCYICSGKNDPGNILLCDECNNGFHMTCLSPPVTEIPEEDWYCPSCKRDSNDVIAPGAAKQAKKTTVAKGNRDWGRGMACVGKTKDCAMPANHFGPIPGIEVGMCWRFRFQASEVGVHRPLISGIHGRDEEGAYSIVLSGGYEDDVDNGEEFTYTGSGGRDLSGNKRTAVQSSNQKLTRQNKALARNCPVKLSESGGDAGDKWRTGKPVRVIRSYKTLKHCDYAPTEGIRYDGIYKVVKYYPETGLSGFRVWKYLLRRDDPSPAPWAPGAKKFSIIYPDGFLEAEAEKKAIKNATKKSSKRTLQSTENERPVKKLKAEPKGGLQKMLRTSTRSAAIINKKSEEAGDDKENSEDQSFSTKLPSPKTPKTPKTPKIKLRKKSRRISSDSEEETNAKEMETDGEESKDTDVGDQVNGNRNGDAGGNHSNSEDSRGSMDGDEPSSEQLQLSDDERALIKADSRNDKLWSDCLRLCKKNTKQEFIQHVTEIFLCIICQSIAINPVTTPCLHNFCKKCIMRAFKQANIEKCPYCRHKLDQHELEENNALRDALRTILPGYDAGKH